jgi:hypothetical protein
VEPRDVGEGTATPTPSPLLELEATDVQEVAVVGASGSYTLTRVAGGWEVDGEETNDQVDGVVSRLASPSVLAEVPAGVDPEDYGFATPTLTVTLTTAAGEEHVLQVGDEVQISPDFYVRLEGEDRIVLLSSSDLNQLSNWVDEPPLAPTPTPEATETPEGGEAPEGEEAEADADADAEGEEAVEEEEEPPAEESAEPPAGAEEPGEGDDEAGDDEAGDEDELEPEPEPEPELTPEATEDAGSAP